MNDRRRLAQYVFNTGLVAWFAAQVMVLWRASPVITHASEVKFRLWFVPLYLATVSWVAFAALWKRHLSSHKIPAIPAAPKRLRAVVISASVIIMALGVYMVHRSLR